MTALRGWPQRLSIIFWDPLRTACDLPRALARPLGCLPLQALWPSVFTLHNVVHYRTLALPMLVHCLPRVVVSL